MKKIKQALLAFVILVWIAGDAQAGAGGGGYLNLCHRIFAPKILERAEQEPYPSDNSVIWVRSADELSLVSELMNRAFAQEPLFNYMAPDVELKRDLIRTLVRHAFISGSIVRTPSVQQASGVGPVGAALWFHDSAAQIGPLDIILTGQAPLIPRFGLFHTFDLLRLDSFMAKTRKRVLEGWDGEEIIHLLMVGVDPAFQGQGWASKLITPVLDYSSSERMPVVLETHDPKNLPIYEHLGFEIVHQERFPVEAPTTSTMVFWPPY